MLTRDRLRGWGIQVSPLCLLCNVLHESRQHLFFDCAYSKEIWSSFTTAANLNAPPLFEDSIIWITHSTSDKNVKTILKILFHASVYFIWKERNARLHTNVARSPSSVLQDIKGLLRRKLDPMSRAQRNSPSTVSFLTTWFSVFQVH
ncbi:unnamed protein product [Microthlaspi erraticum]|uniref:Reverse transcriptase zinc-binding domain-containing protein n=1 Tax=Microthlaspi erraticum TaxID=1685480 RepID=A0A6D2I2A0_9BRAS|nr:unnamed protein product [Microthlaspi erraticum]